LRQQQKKIIAAAAAAAYNARTYTKGTLVTKRELFAVLGFFITMIVIVLAYIAYLMMDAPNANPGDNVLNPITVIEPPLPVPDFSLTNQQGENISLSDLRGKAVLLTFGFIHCPDVCPITLSEMRMIHEQMGSDAINYVFITVDGERDTPEVLATYFTTMRVDSFMIGMTGTEAELRQMGLPYGLDFRYGEADALGNYTVEHTAGMFLLNNEGEWIRRYTYGMEREDIVADLRAVLQ
jgi:protein SCO1